MFAKEEINDLDKLYDDIRHVRLESFLTDEDLETISYNNEIGTSMAIRNLRNRVSAPRNTHRLCTVTVQRLHTNSESSTFAEWLEAVAETILYNEDTDVKVGFSFIAWKPLKNERIYLFSTKPFAPFKFVVSDQDELMKKFKRIGSITDSELLNRTFIKSLQGNAWSKSGFCPLKIVCSYIYITK